MIPQYVEALDPVPVRWTTKRTTWDLQPEMAMSMITFGLGGENVTDQVLAEFPDGLSRGKGPCNQIT